MPRLAGRQIHRNNVEAHSPPHYWKFALYNVFVDKRLILWTNWRTKWLSQNQPLQHSYYFQRICTKWLRMVTLASIMQAFESPLLWGKEPPKHIDDHTGCFGCWVEFKHLFHSDCFFDTSSDHYHCWKIFQLHEKNQTFLCATMADTRLNSLALVHIHRDFRVYINSVTDSFNEKKNRKIKLIWTVKPSI